MLCLCRDFCNLITYSKIFCHLELVIHLQFEANHSIIDKYLDTYFQSKSFEVGIVWQEKLIMLIRKTALIYETFPSKITSAPAKHANLSHLLHTSAQINNDERYTCNAHSNNLAFNFPQKVIYACEGTK